MKIFVLEPHENWICDRLITEWKENNKEITTDNPLEADIIWLLPGWQWRRLPIELLKNKKVVVTVHHIVPGKFNQQKRKDFFDRDDITDYYHAPCEKTADQVTFLTSRPILVQPFWVNQSLWYPIEDREALKEKYRIPADRFIIGSFQRDTEGKDLRSPKLEKGPDQLVEIIKDIVKVKSPQEISVVLSGPRRNYVIRHLTRNKIPHLYRPNATFEEMNELYNCLDLYIVASRYEGGPQAIVECAASKVPIISTNVGLAPEILSEDSIFHSVETYSSAKPNVDVAYDNVKKHFMPDAFASFVDFFEKI